MTARRSPRNPWLGFLYAGIALLGAAAGVVLVVLDWSRIAGFELGGQRTEGLVVTLPVLLGVGGVVAFVRAVRAVGPWLRYRRETPADVQRHDRRADASQQHGLNIVMTAVGVLAFAAAVALAFARPERLAGVAAQIEFAAVLVIVAIALVRTGVAGLAARLPGGPATG